MNRQTRPVCIQGALLALAALLPFTTAACGGAADGSSVSPSEAALVGSVAATGGVGPALSGGWAPIHVYPAKALWARKVTSSSVTVAWNEHGGNGQTILYRQLYDLAGNPSGGRQAIHTWTALPMGPVTFVDSNAVKTVRLARVGGGIADNDPIQPDHEIGYEVVEVASGYSDCEYDHAGYTCATSSTIAYTPGAVPYGASRIQLRLRVAQATAGASNLHVRAELSPDNATWIDSTQNDFAVGSNITYDLATDNIDSRSDIAFIDLWTPDSDGICIDELQLEVDDTTTFRQSFAPCRWVRNDSERILIPFAALRSSAEWQAYSPHDYSPDHRLITFFGYSAEGLTSYLDSSVGSHLRNPIPKPVAGNDAKLGARTTLTRTDGTHLHVQQHVVDISTPLGTVYADPTYDLVIHHADPVCAGWCVDVENAKGNSSSDGAWDYVLDALSLGSLAVVHGAVNGDLEDALSKYTSSLPDLGQTPLGELGYCFAPATVEHGDPVPVMAQLFVDGVATPFDAGSLTVCLYPPSN